MRGDANDGELPQVPGVMTEGDAAMYAGDVIESQYAEAGAAAVTLRRLSVNTK
jgi:hypothetical protein